MLDRVLRALAVVATAGMLLVLVMGATVTTTGSGEGCGRSWPLCNGEFIPEFTVATAIEYSHRAVSGVEGLLVAALTTWMLVRWRQHREVQVLAPLMLGSIVLQAALGAAAVMVPQSPEVLASHFGVSLVAFAATYLSAVVVFERTGRARAPRAAAPPEFRWSVFGVGAYVLIVVYLGAYLRHAHISLACADWPLCNGQVIPPLDGPTGIVFAHRVGALGAVILFGWLASRARSAGMAQRLCALLFVLGLVQALSGALVVTTRLGLFSTLLHAGIMAVLFALLALVTRRVLHSVEPVRLPGVSRSPGVA